MDIDLMDCSICLTRFRGKIILCEGGHSFCDECARQMRKCPKCFKPMTAKRNYDMETVVSELNKNVKFLCKNQGCSYNLAMDQHSIHETECKYRTHLCQLSIYTKQNCNWNGVYEDLLKHYKHKHPHNCRMAAVTKHVLISPVFEDFKDLQLLPFLDGKQMFYYKHKIDKTLGLAYWVFQFVGPAKEAKNYTYEFEINGGEHSKFKINGVCSADTEDCERIMEKQRCVCLTLTQLRNFTNEEGDIDVRFRISTVNHVPVGTNSNVKIGQNTTKTIGTNSNIKIGQNTNSKIVQAMFRASALKK